jgi:uncharacterized protein YydD (DUF2326 family)
MLIEIRCDEFKCNGEVRKPIRFANGLNTVLGSETGSNSIGKSTFLMIIDFAFGGEDYVLKSTDVQTQVGPHVIQFKFEFDGKPYYFSRETINHTIVHKCNAEYVVQGEMKLDEYRKFLFEHYKIKLPHINFRDIVGRYFRIYGRDNLDEKHPLHMVGPEKPGVAVMALMKLFGRYAAIADLEKATKEKKAERDAYKKAQDFHFVPRVTKTQLAKNERRIEELTDELETLAQRGGSQLMGLDSEQAEVVGELKSKLTAAKRQRGRLTSQLNALTDDFTEPVPTDVSHDWGGLARFFPGVDLKKLEDIERFHSQLITVLNLEFQEEQQRITSLIGLAETEIATLEEKIRESGVTPKVSKVILEEYSSTRGQIRAIAKENETYTTMQGLKDDVTSMAARLLALQEEQIGFLQSEINAKMDKINDVVYGGEKKPPVLTIKKPNSYSFMTPDDTGTGTSYKGLVVFDLAVMALTVLPALIHDSVILKQIADEPLEKIIELYAQTPKQVFIALDKKGSYLAQMQKLLEQTTVLELSDGGNELFGRSWNVK